MALDSAPAPSAGIQAYCLDFNWAPTRRRSRPIATPGEWAQADPVEHVAWYEAMGANVIQTFAVSTNGHAWYKNSFAPEQPGLKHDFLTEMVQLGHARGMRVFGYFTIGTNPVWAERHPEQSYGISRTYHIPYTDDYLEYLSKSIHDAVSKTGMDGFMIDWVWMPKRESTEGKWIESEKALYQQLMGEPFPGEEQLSTEQDTAYSRKAIARCWQAIKQAAKSADPDCIIWLTVNNMHHPHVINSTMYQEVDWLMNEAGRVDEVLKAKAMVGEHTQLITCLADWNGSDPSRTVPEAIAHGIGLYGFTTPASKSGLVPLEPIFTRQVTELAGDAKNIAMLARAYRGKSEHARWQDAQFVEPETPPPFRLTFQRRGRGWQDTAHVHIENSVATITVKTPYGRGAGQLTKADAGWPEKIVFELHKKPGKAPQETTLFGVNDGNTGALFSLEESGQDLIGRIQPNARLERGMDIRFTFADSPVATAMTSHKDSEIIRVELPRQLLEANPDALFFQWGSKYQSD